jgi:chemotaxis protein CheY-P-specific phosphatase CheC
VNEPMVRHLLERSGVRALETMFFTMPDSVSSDMQRPTGALVGASVSFKGSPPGRFGLILSEPVGREIAANFLGVEDGSALSPAQIAEVSGELSNIICGAVLTDLECNAEFDLSVPVPVHVTAADPGPDYGDGSPVACRFEVAGGSIVLYLAFGETT